MLVTHRHLINVCSLYRLYIFSIILTYNKTQRQNCIGGEMTKGLDVLRLKKQSKWEYPVTLGMYQSRDDDESLEKKWDFWEKEVNKEE